MNGLITSHRIGILHPGEMGISVAATIKNSGHEVYWVSDGRSPQTRARAEQHNLRDAGTLTDLCAVCSAIISVCPPDAAEALAGEVITSGFRGLYLDANAISPQRARRMAQAFADAGATFVDGSIIGGPAWQPHSTWLYLSGPSASDAATYFASGPLETVALDGPAGRASALKMCYAAYSKGTAALLAAILAAAEFLEVRPSLEEQWLRDRSEPAAAASRVGRSARKAWRFAGEMDEIADTFDGVGLPAGFHRAAAEMYRRMSGFKGRTDPPSLEEVLQALIKEEQPAD